MRYNVKSCYKYLLFILQILLFYNTSFSVRYVRGPIEENKIWEKKEGPYVVLEDVTVKENVTLSIEGGSIIKFFYAVEDENKKNFIIKGNIKFFNTENGKVIFTSIRDDEYGGDTNYDGDATKPQPGDWGYIKIENSDVIFSNCVVRFGGCSEKDGSNNFQIWCYNSSPQIVECIIENVYKELKKGYIPKAIFFELFDGSPRIINNVIRNAGDGVYMVGTYDYPNNPVIAGNQILNCSGTGIYCENILNGGIISNNITSNCEHGMRFETSKPVVRYNGIYGNRNYGIYNETPDFIVDAIYNWWGDMNGPKYSHEQKTCGDRVSSGIKFEPYSRDNKFPYYLDEIEVTVVKATETIKKSEIPAENKKIILEPPYYSEIKEQVKSEEEKKVPVIAQKTDEDTYRAQIEGKKHFIEKRKAELEERYKKSSAEAEKRAQELRKKELEKEKARELKIAQKEIEKVKRQQEILSMPEEKKVVSLGIVKKTAQEIYEQEKEKLRQKQAKKEEEEFWKRMRAEERRSRIEADRKQKQQMLQKKSQTGQETSQAQQQPGIKTASKQQEYISKKEQELRKKEMELLSREQRLKSVQAEKQRTTPVKEDEELKRLKKQIEYYQKRIGDMEKQRKIEEELKRQEEKRREEEERKRFEDLRRQIEEQQRKQRQEYTQYPVKEEFREIYPRIEQSKAVEQEYKIKKEVVNKEYKKMAIEEEKRRKEEERRRKIEEERKKKEEERIYEEEKKKLRELEKELKKQEEKRRKEEKKIAEEIQKQYTAQKYYEVPQEKEEIFKTEQIMIPQETVQKEIAPETAELTSQFEGKVDKNALEKERKKALEEQKKLQYQLMLEERKKRRARIKSAVNFSFGYSFEKYPKEVNEKLMNTEGLKIDLNIIPNKKWPFMINYIHYNERLISINPSHSIFKDVYVRTYPQKLYLYGDELLLNLFLKIPLGKTENSYGKIGFSYPLYSELLLGYKGKSYLKGHSEGIGFYIDIIVKYLFFKFSKFSRCYYNVPVHEVKSYSGGVIFSF